jgi:alkylated DNA repair dioxygenase AlkB
MSKVILNKLEPTGGNSYIAIWQNAIDPEKQREYIDWQSSRETFVGGTTPFGIVPRSQYFSHMDGRNFNNKWKDQTNPRWTSVKYDTTLLELQAFVQSQLHTFGFEGIESVQYPTINSCLINKYVGGDNSIRAHRDNQTSFGPTPTVIGVSLGEEREIVFKRIIYDPERMSSIKEDRENPEEIRIKLKSGSMFVMGGEVQKYYSHEIPKCKDSTGTRYSLTFREHINE